MTFAVLEHRLTSAETWPSWGPPAPGIVMSAKALLEENADPTDDEISDWMMGSLCRCTGYYGIMNSIKAAAKLMKEAR